MKFIYYNVDRLSLVLPWKTHRYSKGSKSRKGKERGEMSIGNSTSSETVRQSATHSELNELEEHVTSSEFVGGIVNQCSALTEFILTPKSPHLSFWLWSPFFDMKKPIGGREAKQASRSAAGFRCQRDTPPHLCHLEEFKVGSTSSLDILEPVLKEVSLTRRPVFQRNDYIFKLREKPLLHLACNSVFGYFSKYRSMLLI